MRRDDTAASPPTEPTQLEKLIGYIELGRWLDVPVPTLRCWVARGQIPHLRLGARCVRFDRASIASWIESRRGGAQ
jgi:excisionase family DNA binding protein